MSLFLLPFEDKGMCSTFWAGLSEKKIDSFIVFRVIYPTHKSLYDILVWFFFILSKYLQLGKDIFKKDDNIPKSKAQQIDKHVS